MHHIFRVCHKNNGTLIENKPPRYIAVFENPHPDRKKLDKSLPMVAIEVDIQNSPPASTIFIFIVPEINLGTTPDSKTDTPFKKTLEIINRYLDSFRFSENFDDETVNQFVDRLHTNYGLMLLKENTISQEERLYKLRQELAKLRREKKKTANNNGSLNEKELQTQLDVLKRALDLTQEAEKNLQTKTERLEDQLHREKQKTNSSNLETLQAKIVTLTAQLETSQQTLSSTQKTEKKLKHQKISLEEQLEHEKNTKEDLAKQLITSSNDLTNLKESVETLQQKTSADSELMQQLQQMKNTLEASVKTAQNELKEKEGAVSQLNTDMGTLKTKNSDIQAQLDSNTIHANELQKEIDTLVVQKSTAVQQIAAKEEEIKALKEGATHSQTTLSHQDQQITQLTSQITDLHKLIATSKDKLSKLESQSETLATLRTKLEETETAHQIVLHNQTETLKTVQNGLKEKEDAISHLNTESAALERKNKDLQQQLDEQTTTAIGLQEKLTTKQKINTQLIEKNTSLTQALQDKTDELTKALNQLETLTTQSEALAELETKLQETETARNTYEIETSGLKTEIARSETDISRLQEHIDSLKTYLASLEALPLVTTATYPDPQVGELEFDADTSEEESDLDIVFRQKEELKRLLQQVEALKLFQTQFEEAQRALDQKKENIHRLQEKNASLTLRISTTERLLEEAKADLELKSADLDNTRHTLQVELEKNRMLSEKSDAQTRTLEPLQDEVSHLTELNAGLSEQKDTATQALEENTEALNQLNFAQDTLQNHLHERETKTEQLEKVATSIQRADSIGSISLENSHLDSNNHSDSGRDSPTHSMTESHTEALETTLTELEANEKASEKKQVAIAQLLEKIDCAQVSKALVNHAKRVLLNKLSEKGYLLNRSTGEQVEQKLNQLEPSELEKVKKKLAATLLEENTFEQIANLEEQPDKLIKQLIETQLGEQSTLAMQATDIAMHLAQQKIDSYQAKTAQDLENYYQSTHDFIKNAVIRLQLTMQKATSRELRDFARKERISLENLVKLVNNGKFDEKKQEIQAKLNEPGLSAEDKKSYEQAVKSIEGICEQKENILSHIGETGRLQIIETALNVIIDKNDQDSKQAIVRAESPSHFFKVIKTQDELASAREECVNKLSAKINNNMGTVIPDFKGTHTLTEFDSDSTLLEAITVNRPGGLFKKAGEITLTYKAVKKDHMIEFSVDSVNADTRPSFIKKHIKNIDFVKISTQSMLEAAQGGGEGHENKGFGLLILNTNDKNWKTRYALIKAYTKLFPTQRKPTVLLEGKYTNASLISEKSLQPELQKLKDKFIKEYKELARSDTYVDSFNTQTNLLGSSALN